MWHYWKEINHQHEELFNEIYCQHLIATLKMQCHQTCGTDIPLEKKPWTELPHCTGNDTRQWRQMSPAHQFLIFAREASRDLSRDFSRGRSGGLQSSWQFVQNMFFPHSFFFNLSTQERLLQKCSGSESNMWNGENCSTNNYV